MSQDVPGIEVFSTGPHKGRDYTEQDLQDIADNFKRFSTGDKRLVDVPIVIGHEETQPLLDNTGIPKVGGIDSLEKKNIPCDWCNATGTMTLGDGQRIKCPACFGETNRTILEAKPSFLHPKIADLVRNGNYDKCSLEVYTDKPPEGVPATGMMARRLAILGGQLPQIKTLADLPTNFSESVPRAVRMRVCNVVTQNDGIAIFSETVPIQNSKPKGPVMDRTAMLAALDQMGVDVSALTPEACNDVALKAIYDSLSPAAKNDEGKDLLYPPGSGDGMTPDKMAAYSERRKKFSEYCKKMAESESPKPAPPTTETPEETAKRSEKEADKMSETFKKFCEDSMAKLKTELLDAVKPAQETVARFTEETERQTVQTFCENMVKAGRLPAAALDGTNPKVRSMPDRLMSLDNKAVVAKFTENGKTVGLTARQEAMEEIRQRPVLSRTEKLQGGGGAAGAVSDADREVATVTAHYESFAEDFQRIGTTKEDFVNAFKAEQKRNRTLTAEKYLGKKVA